jgi:hypothetical protein
MNERSILYGFFTAGNISHSVRLTDSAVDVLFFKARPLCGTRRTGIRSAFKLTYFNLGNRHRTFGLSIIIHVNPKSSESIFDFTVACVMKYTSLALINGHCIVLSIY